MGRGLPAASGAREKMEKKKEGRRKGNGRLGHLKNGKEKKKNKIQREK